MMVLLVWQLLAEPTVKIFLDGLEPELHLTPAPSNERVHLHLEGLLYVSSCASSGD
jgi:hypothetical protein